MHGFCLDHIADPDCNRLGICKLIIRDINTQTIECLTTFIVGRIDKTQLTSICNIKQGAIIA